MSSQSKSVSSYLAAVAAASAPQLQTQQLNFDSLASSSCPTSAFTYPSDLMVASNSNNEMMKLYNSKPTPGNLAAASSAPSSCHTRGTDSYEWNSCVGPHQPQVPPPNYSVASAGMMPAKTYQTQQPQQFQQLDQINFLIRQECMSEIDQACKELGISADPYNWTVQDVQKWLFWMQRWIQLPMLKLEHFQMNGMALCSLTEEDFKQRTFNGEKLYSKLEIWRMAINYFRPEAIIDTLFGETEESAPAVSSSSQYGNSLHPSHAAANYGGSCGSPCSADSFSNYGSPVSQEGYGMSDGLPSYAESSYSLSTSGSPASPASSHSSAACPSPYMSQHNNGASPQYGYQNQYQEQHCELSPQQLMTSRGQTSDYASSDDDEMSDDDKCFIAEYQRTQMLQNRSQMSVSMSTAAPALHTSLPQIKIEPSDYTPSASPIYPHQQQQHFGTGLLRPQQYAPIASISVKPEPSSSPSTTIPVPSTAAPLSSSTVSAPRTSSSSHIHLWQFLKELLAYPQQFGSSIRWLDRSKGIFKIEDSVRVAKLWGGRKNRPAMNYDKLSRSIRQYYKKGIMKKTERSQRLVYQFCQPYSL